MSIEKKWKEIGGVVGTTSTDTYEFVISDLSASVGDIVITKSSTPLTKNVLVWGRIVWMERTNPTFPSEFAAELAREKKFRSPIALAIDCEHRLMVLEALRHRLQVYTQG